MQIYRSNETFRKPSENSIFLAGPSLRGDGIKTDWREEVIEILDSYDYSGEVYVPEPFAENYAYQYLWEEKALMDVGCILFWIPRDLEKLPGFTTNCEFGEWMNSEKVVLGFPKGAPNMRYLELKALQRDIPITNTLEDTVCNAADMVETLKDS